MQILIVEDEKRLADVLGQLCREQRWQADVVYTGTDGLAYAQSIAHTHRGRIKAQSAGGVTTFTVTLPLHT